MLLGIAVVLVIMHVTAMVLWFNDLLPNLDWWHIAIFDLDEEAGFGTWFSAIILLIAGQLLLLQACAARSDGEKSWKWWLILGLGFCFLSLDEIAGLHEYINSLAEDTPWTTFAAPVVLLLGLAFLPFLVSLPTRTRWLFVFAGILYIGGAIGVERGTDWYDDNGLLDTLPYNLWTAAEEFLEMTGVILFIYALLNYFGRVRASLKINLTIES